MLATVSGTERPRERGIDLMDERPEYRFSGGYGEQGSNDPKNPKHTKYVNGTKGVMRMVRSDKRREAEARNSRTNPLHRRANVRAFGYDRLTKVPADRMAEYAEFVKQRES